MRLPIAGTTGLVASHMAEYALSQSALVFGSSRWHSKIDNIEHLRSRITRARSRSGAPLIVGFGDLLERAD